MTAPKGAGGGVDGRRVHVSVLFDLARAEGVDRYFGSPRSRVGGFQSAALLRHGLSLPVRLLPARGDRWPAAAVARAEQIAADTCRRMRQSGRAAIAKAGGES